MTDVKQPVPDWISVVGLEAGSRRLFILACVLALLAVLVNVKIFVELESDSMRHELMAQLKTVSEESAAAVSANPTVFESITDSRQYLMVLLALTTACFGLFIYIIIGRFAVPLSHIARGARRITEGNLDVVIPLQSSDDVAGLGETITDIATNYQEILLLTGTTVGNCKARLEKLEQQLGNSTDSVDRSQIDQYLQAIREDLDSLSQLVGEFRYYETRFNGRAVVREDAPEGS